MYRRLLIFFTKLLMQLLRLTGRSGSALPGLVMERLYPSFLPKVLKSVEKKIILITGTNGKTTTTKMLVAGLRGTGARVVTNSTGSNMTRGLIAALIEDMTYLGNLKPTDWFVFEMDEAYAPIFTEQLSPSILVALNVLRDQLDRYGEINTTARLIRQAALKADTFVFNGQDPLLSGIAEAHHAAYSFGAAPKLASHITNEQTQQGERVATKKVYDVTLAAVGQTVKKQWLTLDFGAGQKYQIDIPVEGFHNALNATAVAAVVTRVVPKSFDQIFQAISSMPVPFGRGEQLRLQDKLVTVALVKNPSGFTANLQTFVAETKPDTLLFVVNDKFADGRDVSWLWDVVFDGVVPKTTKVYTSGIRGYDIALRLQHDGITSETELDVATMLARIMQQDGQTITIVPTYTALFEVREALGKYGKVPRIW